MIHTEIDPLEPQLAEIVKRAINEGIKAYASKMADELIAEYAAILRAEMVRLVAQVSIETMDIVSFQYLGRDLRITVQMPEKK